METKEKHMDWEAKIECDRCGTKATVVVLDSIPYCPKCGKPIKEI